MKNDTPATEKIRGLEKTSRQLEPDSSQREAISGKALDYIERFFESLPESPGYRTGSVPRLKTLHISEGPKPIDQLLGLLGDEVDKIGINSASGRHLGYIPGGGLWLSAVADFLAAAANRYAGVSFSSPGAVEIENQMIRWLVSLVGYPEAAHGNLTSGGSIANLIAVKAARDARKVNSSNVKTSVIYFTEHVHHCLHKAFQVTGLYEAVLRSIPLNDRYQMDVEALRQQLASDAASGLTPFLVVASAGTTDTGAIDPLGEIAALCHRYQTWFHVDAAYGGFFILTDEIRKRLKGIEQSDSLVMDPHKTLFLPYGSGVVLVRNRSALVDSNAHKAAYMHDAYGAGELDPSDTSPELSKHFRGLRMWLPLHVHGVVPFRAALEEKLELSRYFYEEVRKLGFETGPFPDLSVVIFRIAGDDDNALNSKFISALHEDGRVFFSSTTISGRLWMRCAVVSFRTHLEEIRLGLTMVKEVRERVEVSYKL